MNEHGWNIGDRVVSAVDHPDRNSDIVSGMAGYVCFISTERADMGYSDIGVCWDERINCGHNCDGNCEHGHGWFVFGDELKSEPMADFDAATDDELMTLLGIGGG